MMNQHSTLTTGAYISQIKASYSSDLFFLGKLHYRTNETMKPSNKFFFDHTKYTATKANYADKQIERECVACAINVEQKSTIAV